MVEEHTETKQFFTVAEANQRLPLVRAIVQDIVDLYGDVYERRQRLTRMREAGNPALRQEDDLYSEEVLQIEEELEKDLDQIKGYLDELAQLGAELKDPFVGLIDFPSLMDGREVELCWKLGEDEVGFWHEIGAGFQGRQSLLEESVAVDDAEESSLGDPAG